MTASLPYRYFQSLVLVTLSLVLMIACSADAPIAPLDSASTGVTFDSDRPFSSWSFGPVEGLTTVWHKAPAEIVVPTGTTVQFFCGGSDEIDITWDGAVEVERSERGSRAECPIPAPGRYVINVYMTPTGGKDNKKDRKDGPDKVAPSHVCIVRAIDVVPGAIEIKNTTASVRVLSIDETSTNDETMAAFFGGGQRYQVISTLRRIETDHYRTAIGRMISINAEIYPSAFSKMIEWRVGDTRPQLAEKVVHIFDQRGRNEVRVGKRLTIIETYEVEITSHISGRSGITENEEITFRARTIPAGYEQDVTWLSSTKFGRAYPVSGTGETFTVTFNETWGDHPELGGAFQWLGVRADNAIFNHDIKISRSGSECMLAIREFVGRPFGEPINGVFSKPKLPCGLPFPVGPQLVLPINGATVVTYPITGATANQACQDMMNNQGPQEIPGGTRYAGMTELGTNTLWRATGQVGDSLCVHIDSIVVDITVTMPSWTPQTPADSVLWHEFMTQLEIHEQGHVDLYTNGMATVSEAVVCTTFKIHTFASDSLISAAAGAIMTGSQEYQDMEQANDNYDAPHNPTSNPTGTNHGSQNGQSATWGP